MGYLGEFEQLILFSVVKLGDDAYGGTIREAIERRPAAEVLRDYTGGCTRAAIRLARPVKDEQ